MVPDGRLLINCFGVIQVGYLKKLALKMALKASELRLLDEMQLLMATIH